MNVGIVLITFNRIDLLKICLNSIKKASSHGSLSFQYSIHIGINGDDEKTKSYLKSLNWEKTHYDSWPERKRLGEARNAILEKTNKDWIYFLDDDVEVDPEHFLRFEKITKKHPQIKVVGGPNQHLREKNESQLAQEEVLSSFFISGPFAYRYQKKNCNLDAPISQLILCNLFVFKHPDLTFKEHLVGAEENEMLSRLGQTHRPFGFFPELSVHHERRTNLSTFYRQCIQIGKGRGQWESQKNSVLFPFFSLWMILLFLIFCQCVAQLYVLSNPKLKSKKRLLIAATFLLYVGYGKGLIIGAFISNKAL